MDSKPPAHVTPPELADRYLGDGLYARFDGVQVELYTHDGIEKTNRVFLGPLALAAFLAFERDLQLWLKGTGGC